MRFIRMRVWTRSTRSLRGKGRSCSTAGSCPSRRVSWLSPLKGSLTEFGIRAPAGCWSWRSWRRHRDQNAVPLCLGGILNRDQGPEGLGTRGWDWDGGTRKPDSLVPRPRSLSSSRRRSFDQDLLYSPVIHVGYPYGVLVRTGEPVRPVELPHLMPRDAQHAEDLAVERHLVQPPGL